MPITKEDVAAAHRRVFAAIPLARFQVEAFVQDGTGQEEICVFVVDDFLNADQLRRMADALEEVPVPVVVEGPR